MNVYYETSWNTRKQAYEVHLFRAGQTTHVARFSEQPWREQIIEFCLLKGETLMEGRIPTATAHFRKPGDGVIRSIDGVPYEQHG